MLFLLYYDSRCQTIYFTLQLVVRLDLFLKTSRLVKRRTVAKEMCEASRVLVNNREAQPAKEIRPGDLVTIKYSSKHIEIEVISVPDRPGKSAPEELYRVIAETRIERTQESW
jgi:ribosomal 50S subunit-recycling heat shock protein